MNRYVIKTCAPLRDDDLKRRGAGRRRKDSPRVIFLPVAGIVEIVYIGTHALLPCGIAVEEFCPLRRRAEIRRGDQDPCPTGQDPPTDLVGNIRRVRISRQILFHVRKVRLRTAVPGRSGNRQGDQHPSAASQRQKQAQESDKFVCFHACFLRKNLR